jgi:carbonic anhydrase
LPDAAELDPHEDLLGRNSRFASRDRDSLPAFPRLRTLILTCADHRVDPAHVLGLELGDAVVLRNAGGRVVPAMMPMLELLTAAGVVDAEAEGGYELVLMQHTGCGLARLGPEHAELAAEYFGVGAGDVDLDALRDPRAAVRVDVEELARNPRIPGSLSVTGLVYDIDSGQVELVERRSPLRPDA